MFSLKGGFTLLGGTGSEGSISFSDLDCRSGVCTIFLCFVQFVGPDLI